MTIENFKNSLKALTEQNNQLKKDFENLITDKSLPLDDRWNLFLFAAELTNRSNWIEHFGFEKDFEKRTGARWNWYHDYGFEKHQSEDVENVLEFLEMRRASEEQEETEDFDTEGWTNQAIIDAFKEEILSKNLSEFTFDW